MLSNLALLLLLVVTLGSASASRGLPSTDGGDASPRAGRGLLQSPNATDCDRSVKHCSACRYLSYRGTTTKAVCTQCEAGYAVRSSGRACYCAPGYFTAGSTAVDGQTGFTCQPCGANAYCPGAKVTAASSAVRQECGAHKVTTTEFAESDRECVVLPGFGWAPGDNAAACAQGFFNPGYNTRRCSKCSGGLTTLGTNSNSTQDCVAPAGHYYMRGRAAACARGTYKLSIGNNDCDECPAGMTTPPDAVGATDKALCNRVLPGYSLAPTPALGVTAAAECPQDYYRAGEAAVADGQAQPVACAPCGNGMVTAPNTTRAATADECVVPPGYGWVAPSGADTKGAAVICPVGSYNPGYNREPCVKCGNGSITTDGPGSASEDVCYTPAGHGNRRDVRTGFLEGYECPLNTYGSPSNAYGLVDVECTKCMENTHTNQAGSTSPSQCLTDAGYGWDASQANQCGYGYYNPGGNQNKCTYCGDFYNTTSADSAAAGERGSTSAADCKLDFGYQNGTAAGTVEPCLHGWYKDTVGFAACTQCPAGTSTTVALAAVAVSDCDVCRPGFGAGTADGRMDLASPSCSVCQSGTWSGGFVVGGQNCSACPQAQNFTGAMVSRQGALSPEECYQEFVSDAGSSQNFLWWDIIAHDDASTFVYQAGAAFDTVAECQDGCAADAECQYYEFYRAGAPNGAANACFFRKVPGKSVTDLAARIGSADAAWWDAPSGLDGGIVMFEVAEGAYVAYPKTASETIGAALDLSAAGALPGDFKASRAACDGTPDCIGLTWDAATLWRGFKGARWEDAVGKVRVVGNAINSWVAIPTGTEEPQNWSPTP